MVIGVEKREHTLKLTHNSASNGHELKQVLRISIKTVRINVFYFRLSKLIFEYNILNYKNL